jgi:hypothetical protein
MSRAYASTLDISFDVRGGLLVRQIHHWFTLLFLALVHRLPGRVNKAVPVLGDQAVPPHDPATVLADGGAARDLVHPCGRVPIPGGEADQASRLAQPAATATRRASPYRPRRDGDHLLRRAAAVRRQRLDRKDLRHLAQRDDLRRSGKPARATKPNGCAPSRARRTTHPTSESGRSHPPVGIRLMDDKTKHGREHRSSDNGRAMKGLTCRTEPLPIQRTPTPPGPS